MRAGSVAPKEDAPVVVSVVIPTYNRAHLLVRALESVLRQTAPPGEMIVVDDGSNDSTAEIVREKFPEVIYVNQANRGVSAARNTGIRISRGEWIAFLDSDDTWLPDKLFDQNHALMQSGLLVCHTDETWVRDGRHVNQMNKHARHAGWIYKNCLPLCAISPSSVMLNRRVFNEVGLFDESLPACEDYDMWLRVCARFEVSLVGKPLVIRYGGHTDQLSRKQWGLDRFRVLSLEKMLVHGELDPADYSLTLEMLLKKLRILRAGAEKRANEELISACLRKIARWEQVSDC